MDRRLFADLNDYLQSGMYWYSTIRWYFPARLRGEEIHQEQGRSTTRARTGAIALGSGRASGARLRQGAHIRFGNSGLRAEVLESIPDGGRILRFTCNAAFNQVIDEIGETRCLLTSNGSRGDAL